MKEREEREKRERREREEMKTSVRAVINLWTQTDTMQLRAKDTTVFLAAMIRYAISSMPCCTTCTKKEPLIPTKQRDFDTQTVYTAKTRSDILLLCTGSRPCRN